MAKTRRKERRMKAKARTAKKKSGKRGWDQWYKMVRKEDKRYAAALGAQGAVEHKADMEYQMDDESDSVNMDENMQDINVRERIWLWEMRARAYYGDW